MVAQLNAAVGAMLSFDRHDLRSLALPDKFARDFYCSCIVG
jgi:hypothetical protein